MRLIGRRNFLGGLGLGAGAYLLGAMCKQLLPEALGQAAGKKRIYIYFNRMGVNDTATEPYLPQKGATENSINFGPGWAPLEKYRSELLLVRGLFNPFNKDLHGTRWALSVAPEAGKAPMGGAGGLPSLPGDVTLDRLLARTIGRDDPHPSITVVSVPRFISASADGPGKPFPGMPNPIKAYAAIFGNGAAAAGPPPAERLAQEQSMLDFLKGDVARLKGRLAGPELEKLDQYLEAVRGMERKLGALVKTAASCASTVFDPGLDKTFNSDDVRPELIAANLEITINALVCGLTRVATHAFGYDCNYAFLGADPKIGQHGMWHGGPARMHHPLYAYHSANMVTIRDRLGTFREGNGSMADNFLLMIFNEGGGFHHDGWDRHWMMLLGSMGGHFKTGRHLTFAKNTRCISDGFVSVLNAMGVPLETFGVPEVNKGPLPGLT